MLRKSRWLGAMLASAIVVGCGTDAETQQPATTAEPATHAAAAKPVETTPTQTSPPAADRSSRSFSIRYEADDGSTAAATVEVAPLEQLGAALADGYAPACYDGDPERAAVVRGHVTLTNTTHGFDADLTMRLVALHFDEIDAAGTGGWELVEGSGAGGEAIVDSEAGDCIEGVGLLQREAAPEGASLGPIGFGVVFPDYYSPKDPDGDERLLDDWMLSIKSVIGFSETCISGPGVGIGGSVPLGDGDLAAQARAYHVDVRHLPACGA